MTIVVDSFDGYSDLWPCFFSIFKKNWSDCPYQLKLISNYKIFDGIDTINVGEEVCWSQRTLDAIKTIDDEYILLLLEDYFLGKCVKTEDVQAALDFLTSVEGNYLRLTNIPKCRFYAGEKYYPLYSDEEYAINLQASIWKKDFLIESLEKYSGNAWEFEIGFLRSAVNAEHCILDKCFAMLEDPLHIRNGVLKGKWFPAEINFFSKQGIAIAWQERGKLSFFQVAKYNLLAGIKNILSYKTRRKAKRFLRKLGVKFASEL